MYGSIYGDLAGSIYEFEQLKEIKSIDNGGYLSDKSFFSDDTILTVAVCAAIKDDKDYDKYLRKYIIDYMDYKPDFHPYFRSSFSPNLIKWAKSDLEGHSQGNGAMMRISPVGFLFDSEDEVIEEEEEEKEVIDDSDDDDDEDFDYDEIKKKIIEFDKNESKKNNKEYNKNNNDINKDYHFS